VVLRAAQTRIAPLKAYVTYPEKRPYAGLFFACNLPFRKPGEKKPGITPGL
jgi:hypothetical protein